MTRLSSAAAPSRRLARSMRSSLISMQRNSSCRRSSLQMPPPPLPRSPRLTERTMSNSYTKAAFDLTVTVAEADMLRRVIATVELIDDTEAGIDVREAHYTSLGPDFAALFPRSDEDPFA